MENGYLKKAKIIKGPYERAFWYQHQNYFQYSSIYIFFYISKNEFER